MRDSVRSAFMGFTARFEGVISHFYTDVKNLITIAAGNLADPVSTALSLPLVHADGRPATRDEIMIEWSRIKNGGFAQSGHLAAKKVATLHLTPAGIEQVVLAKLSQNQNYLRARFREYDDWPADAQLALLSMAWACGPAFHFPKLEANLAARDFAGAAVNGHMEDSHNPGLVPRNAAQVLLWSNAAAVVAAGADYDVLHYPAAFTTDTTVPDDDRPVFIFPDLDDVKPPHDAA